ncbi:probable disease resistance protein At5g66900 [Arachis stenosperma]|uniref:probable disease resistance protein At5g66900 n=1 Tax=Arachis stenosperma TaxID=217475 RepID=UPI0025AD0237|nr:probable disease resistance protein At5g66900 [Arachis stenosperma]
MADLFSGGAVGAVMGELLRAAIETINKGREFKPTLETNIQTLNAIAPLVDEMMEYNDKLDRPRQEIQRLQSRVRQGQDLARKCSRKLSRRKFLSFPYYQGKLKSEDQSLQRHLSFDVQVQNARNLMEVLLKVDEILNILAKQDFAKFSGSQIQGLSGAPEEPKCMGMDEHLSRLRVELLKDDVSVLVLTGLGGSGKSTLAKKLCWDPHVKGKFGGNIFFVTFSETPNLKNIVRTLFEHCGCKVPEFQSDEDAINKLGILLRLVGRSPILLVLDDVWQSSEALVDKFRFQIPDYKILVTSRVAFQRFGTPWPLEPLDHDDAVSLFRHSAQLNSKCSYMPDDNLVNEIVKGCKGSPLALEVIGGSLCQQPFEVWQDMKEWLEKQSILESGNTDLLSRLQQSLDMLEDKFSVSEKECFMDLGLFPEDQRIPVAILIDMWAELHKFDDNGRKAMTIIHDLTTRNLIKLIVTKKVAKDTDMYYNNHFVLLHDLLRKLAIHQSEQEQIEQRKKLIIELNGDDHPEWWVRQNQQGIFSRLLSLSFLPGRLIEQKQLKVAARVLSISTDENFASDWCDMTADEAEVIVLNIRSSQYSLPQFMEKMNKLKVLIVTNYGFHLSGLKDFEILSALSNLRRIRLEKVSVPSLCILKSLQKLSLHMCNTSQAFGNSSIPISESMPNLVELSIDYCKDLEKLPEGVCNITPLKKLSITNCHKLSALPKDTAKLKNLEVLRLSSCTDLEEMPDGIGRLCNLRCLDISDCVSLSKLPEDIGDLQNLEKLYMKGCSGLSEVPYSVMNFENAKHQIFVLCDEERAQLWENVPSTPNLKIETAKVDISLNWLHGVRC